ncbi:uncharacterized protein [Watersipora subatra]|uniref:uncharacterized protein n=1 Tax=Watersipora subatra TaxID=2589382 RepID=UPI00355B1E7E
MEIVRAVAASVTHSVACANSGIQPDSETSEFLSRELGDEIDGSGEVSSAQLFTRQKGKVAMSEQSTETMETSSHKKEKATTVEQSVQTDKEISMEDKSAEESNTLPCGQGEMITSTVSSTPLEQITEKTEGQIGQRASICSEPETSQRSRGWWSKALLVGLLSALFFVFLNFILIPEDCNSSCHHCGVFDLRRKHYSIPSH